MGSVDPVAAHAGFAAFYRGQEFTVGTEHGEVDVTGAVMIELYFQALVGPDRYPIPVFIAWAGGEIADRVTCLKARRPMAT